MFSFKMPICWALHLACGCFWIQLLYVDFHLGVSRWAGQSPYLGMLFLLTPLLATHSNIFKVCCSTRSDSQTASFRSTTVGCILARHGGMFSPSVFLCSCFYPHQLIGVGWGGACSMLTLVWSCIGCARYGGHRIGWGGACWRWFEVASDVHATVDIGLVPSLGGRNRSAENFACHFATWSMWRCRSVRWSKWKANESSLEHNCSIRCGAIWKSMCPKSWALMKD